jgi:hypothetical protein
MGPMVRWVPLHRQLRRLRSDRFWSGKTLGSSRALLSRGSPAEVDVMLWALSGTVCSSATDL